MSDDGTWTIQISLKSASQTLVNIRGNDEGDLANGLAIIQNLAGQINETETVLGPLQIVGAKPIGVAQAAPATPPVGVGPVAPSAVAPLCKHNQPARYVQGGVSKRTNKAYKPFWTCAQDQAYQCDFRMDG